MRVEADKEKQLYCDLYHANDRLQTLRIISNETHDIWLRMKILRQIQIAQKALEDAVSAIGVYELFG